MDNKSLDFAAIKQNISENKMLYCKDLKTEEPLETTTVATSKLNSEEDEEMNSS
jgi:hypothetical protein